MAVHRYHTYAIIFQPRGVAKTQEHVHINYAHPHASEELKARNADQWKSIFVEVVFLVKGVQRGRHAVSFDGGRFSPVVDGPTYLFHTWNDMALLSALYTAAANEADYVEATTFFLTHA